MKIIAIALGLVISTLASAQDLFGDDKDSYVLLPAEVVSSGIVSNVDFSSSGRFIIYRKVEISSFEAKLLGRDVQNRSKWFRYDRKTKVNSKIEVPESTDELICLGDDQSIFFSGAESSDPQGFVNMSTGTSTKTSFDIASIIYAGEKSSSPYFIIRSSDSTISLVRPNGQSVLISLPSKVSVIEPLASDHGTITFAATLKAPTPQVGHLVYRIDTGATSFVEKPRDELRLQRYDDRPVSRFWFEDLGDLSYVKMMDLARNTKADVPLRAKLGTAKCNPRFAPTSDCVAYEDAGALLIREIKPIDLALAKKLLLDAAKAKSIMDAKQIATSLMVYASDTDDSSLPGQEGWDTKVLPYCKDGDLLKRFNYTYKGGSLSSLENPATTELGFTMGPGGRAVAYADGSVKWIPNP